METESNCSYDSSNESDQSSNSYVQRYQCYRCPLKPILTEHQLDEHKKFHKLQDSVPRSAFSVAVTLPRDHPVVLTTNRRLLRKRVGKNGVECYDLLAPVVPLMRVEEDERLWNVYQAARDRNVRSAAAAAAEPAQTANAANAEAAQTANAANAEAAQTANAANAEAPNLSDFSERNSSVGHRFIDCLLFSIVYFITFLCFVVLFMMWHCSQLAVFNLP